MVSKLVRRRTENAQKKSRRFRRLLKLITGRRQTEWTGTTRCPNEDKPSHNRESLTGRKRADLFSLRLPCRSLAECGRLTQPFHRPRVRGDDGVWFSGLRLEK